MRSYDVLATCISEYPEPYSATIRDTCPANDLARGLLSLYPPGKDVEWFHSEDIGCERYYDLVGAWWSSTQTRPVPRWCGESDWLVMPKLRGARPSNEETDHGAPEHALFLRPLESEEGGESIQGFQARVREELDGNVIRNLRRREPGSFLHLLVHPVVVGQLLCWFYGYPHTWIATFTPAHGDSYLLRVEVGDDPGDWRIVACTPHPRASLPTVAT